jgi:hypothetical protein
MADYTFLDFAEDVLQREPTPLPFQEIWERGNEAGLVTKLASTGKTPWQTLGARLFVDVRDNPRTKFLKVGRNPARFFLKARQGELSHEDLEAGVPSTKEHEKVTKVAYAERALHPLLAYFAFSNTSFNRGRQVYTKTVFHEKTRPGAPSEWVHPDMVGVYFPLEDWNKNLIEFNKATDKGALRLYSFEIKKVIDRGNYRESFFQAVSKSSWANEGYLVAAEIQQRDDLLAELERLSNSFGIGLIHLDLEDIDSSSVKYPASRRPYLDWELMNKLCEANEDFEAFIRDVKTDYEGGKIHKSEYDPIVSDPEGYIKKMVALK